MTLVCTTAERGCQVCKRPLIRRSDEKRRDFNRRVTCSAKACIKAVANASRALSVAKARAAAAARLPKRACKACGAVLVRHLDEGSHSFKRRTTCSVRCAGTLANVRRSEMFAEAREAYLLQSKPCAECGLRFSPRVREHSTDFARRLLCSRPCADKWRAHKSREQAERARFIPSGSMDGVKFDDDPRAARAGRDGRVCGALTVHVSSASSSAWAVT